MPGGASGNMAQVTLPMCIILALVLPEMLGAPREVQSLQCHDWQGKPVVDGVKYIPKKDDPCMACVCDEGFPVMCTAVLCSPPDCLLYEAVEGECCRFNCLQPDHAPNNKTKHAITPFNKSNEADKTNLGLRLIASTVTSFLILALLVFMVHRLRQRRMLIMMRRMHMDQRDEDTVAYMSQFDQVDMGIEYPPYQEPPPPYTPPKPPDIPHGEAPPPYEVTPGGENSNDRETNNNTNLPATGRGPRPLQGADTLPVASSSMDRMNANGYPVRHYDLPSPTDEGFSLPISRSTREIQAHSEALTPPGGGRHGGLQQSPSEHEYENLREICARHLMLQRAPSSEAETASAISTPPDFSPDFEYPAALGTMTTSFHSQGAPSSSQMVVRMHNDNPRSFLLRDSDVMTTSLPAYLSTDSPSNPNQLLEDAHPWVPSYRTQFIKRSESIEIKCGSNSPRNSFYTDEGTAGPPQPEDGEQGAAAGSPSGSTGSGSPLTDQETRPKKKRPLAPNVTWNKSCRPFRIRMDSTSPVGAGDNGVAAGGLMGPHSNERPLRHSTYGGPCISSPSPPSVHQNRHSMPPLDLELADPVDAILGASGSKYYPSSNGAGYSGMSTDPSPADEILEVGISPSGSGRVSSGSSSQNAVCANGSAANQNAVSSASSSGQDTSSPQSPMGPNMIRSTSIASQVSQFSVCSETGEKKRPRPNVIFPRSIRNDVHYPLSPLSSNHAAPMSSIPPVLKTRRQSPPSALSSGSSSQAERPNALGGSGPSPITSPLQAAQSPLGAAPRNLNEVPQVERHRTCRNKISYVDVSPEREKSSSAASTPSSSDSSGGYPKQPTATSPMTNSTMSSLSPLSPDCETLDNQNCLTNSTSPTANSPKQEEEQDERNAARKVKKQHSPRKRRPRSIPAANGPDASKSTPATSHSPERLRRLSRNVDTSTTFKQYGFIDDPDVLNNARDPAMGHNKGSLPRNHNLRRQHSHEKDSTRERRDNSGDRKREKSHERKTSHERKDSQERREGSGERKVGRSSSSRSNSHERERSKHDGQERSGSQERHQRSKSAERGVQRNSSTTRITSPDGADTACVADRMTLDNHVTTDNSPNLRNEGRKRERDYASQAASLERRKKRRSTGDHLINESSQNNNYPVSLQHSNSYTTNGFQPFPDSAQYFTTNCEDVDQETQPKEVDLTPTHHKRRTKNSQSQQSRNSVPLIVHRNR